MLMQYMLMQYMLMQYIQGGFIYRVGEHRDFPPLRLISPPLEFLKCTKRTGAGTCLISPPEEPAVDNPVLIPDIAKSWKFLCNIVHEAAS